jgi:hypothetical protein
VHFALDAQHLVQISLGHIAQDHCCRSLVFNATLSRR